MTTGTGVGAGGAAAGGGTAGGSITVGGTVAGGSLLGGAAVKIAAIVAAASVRRRRRLQGRHDARRRVLRSLDGRRGAALQGGSDVDRDRDRSGKRGDDVRHGRQPPFPPSPCPAVAQPGRRRFSRRSRTPMHPRQQRPPANDAPAAGGTSPERWRGAGSRRISGRVPGGSDTPGSGGGAGGGSAPGDETPADVRRRGTAAAHLRRVARLRTGGESPTGTAPPTSSPGQPTTTIPEPRTPTTPRRARPSRRSRSRRRRRRRRGASRRRARRRQADEAQGEAHRAREADRRRHTDGGAQGCRRSRRHRRSPRTTPRPRPPPRRRRPRLSRRRRRARRRQARRRRPATPRPLLSADGEAGQGRPRQRRRQARQVLRAGFAHPGRGMSPAVCLTPFEAGTSPDRGTRHPSSLDDMVRDAPKRVARHAGRRPRPLAGRRCLGVPERQQDAEHEHDADEGHVARGARPPRDQRAFARRTAVEPLARPPPSRGRRTGIRARWRLLGFFAHESRNGTPFWQRVKQYYFTSSKTWTVGENLAMFGGDHPGRPVDRERVDVVARAPGEPAQRSVTATRASRSSITRRPAASSAGRSTWVSRSTSAAAEPRRDGPTPRKRAVSDACASERDQTGVRPWSDTCFAWFWGSEGERAERGVPRVDRAVEAALPLDQHVAARLDLTDDAAITCTQFVCVRDQLDPSFRFARPQRCGRQGDAHRMHPCTLNS